ncbi:MAG: S1C family serine protease [Planctomycetia bacterium]|nr:S1C family serine protease [Planctomycetia bacterium]
MSKFSACTDKSTCVVWRGFRLVAALLLVVFFTGEDRLHGAEQQWTRTPRSHFVAVVEDTCRSVVSIQGEKQYEVNKRSFGRDVQYDVFNGMGTGVVIDSRGYILTNYHVVKGLLKLEVVTSDGERYRDVELIRNDVATDLAILKIKPKRPLQKIRMGRSDRVQLAEDVFAIGNPYGYHCSISRGIVSALERPLEVNENLSYESVIQTDAAINPGNSGGPLINIDGEMIGLNAAVREEAENIAFAIPVDMVANVAERMIRQSVAKMTHHGLKFKVVDSDMADYPSCGNGEDCLIVEEVDAKSPAALIGIEPGDVISTSNGFAVHSSLDFTCSLIGLGLSDVAKLHLVRHEQELDATLAFSELASENSTMIAAENPDQPSRRDASNAERYHSATTSNAFAQAVHETANPDEALESSNSTQRSRVAQTVWKSFGVEVEPVGEEEYHELYPNLQSIDIGKFSFVPVGGVSVTRVNSNGALCSGEARIEPGDFIFGFGVGEEKERQLSVLSLENLYYIIRSLDEFTSVDEGRARVYLIRSGRPYFLEIDLNQAR